MQSPTGEERLAWLKKDKHDDGTALGSVPEENGEAGKDAQRKLRPYEEVAGLKKPLGENPISTKSILLQLEGKTTDEQAALLARKEIQDLFLASIALRDSDLWPDVSRLRKTMDGGNAKKIVEETLGLLQTLSAFDEKMKDDDKRATTVQIVDTMDKQPNVKHTKRSLLQILAEVQQFEAVRSMQKFTMQTQTLLGTGDDLHFAAMTGDSAENRASLVTTLTELAEKLALHETKDINVQGQSLTALRHLANAIDYFQPFFHMDGAYTQYLVQRSRIEGCIAFVQAQIAGYEPEAIATDTSEQEKLNKREHTLKTWLDADKEVCGRNGGIAWMRSDAGINNLKKNLEDHATDDLALHYLAEAWRDEQSWINRAHGGAGVKYLCTIAAITEIQLLYRNKATSGGTAPSPTNLYLWVQTAFRAAMQRNKRGEEIIQKNATITDRDIEQPLRDVENLQKIEHPTEENLRELRFLIDWFATLGRPLPIPNGELLAYEMRTKKTTNGIEAEALEAYEGLASIATVPAVAEALTPDGATPDTDGIRTELTEKHDPQTLLHVLRTVREHQMLFIDRVLEDHLEEENTLLTYLRDHCTLQQLDAAAPLAGFSDALAWVVSPVFPETEEDLKAILEKAKAEPGREPSLAPSAEAQTVGDMKRRRDGIRIKQTKRQTDAVPIVESVNQRLKMMMLSGSQTSDLQTQAIQHLSNREARKLYAMQLADAKCRLERALEKTIQLDASRKLDELDRKAPDDGNGQPTDTATTRESLERIKQFGTREARHPTGGIDTTLDHLASDAITDTVEDPLHSINKDSGHTVAAQEDLGRMWNAGYLSKETSDLVRKLAQYDTPPSQKVQAGARKHRDRLAVLADGERWWKASEVRKERLEREMNGKDRREMERKITQLKRKITQALNEARMIEQDWRTRGFETFPLRSLLQSETNWFAQLRDFPKAIRGLIGREEFAKAADLTANAETALEDILQPFLGKLREEKTEILPPEEFKKIAGPYFKESHRTKIYAFYDDKTNTIYQRSDCPFETVLEEEIQHKMNAAINKLDASWLLRVDNFMRQSDMAREYEAFAEEVLPQKEKLEGDARRRMAANELLAQMTAHRKVAKSGGRSHYSAARQDFLERAEQAGVRNIVSAEAAPTPGSLVHRGWNMQSGNNLGRAAASAAADEDETGIGYRHPSVQQSGGGNGNNEDGGDGGGDGNGDGGSGMRNGAPSPEGDEDGKQKETGAKFHEILRDIGKVLYKLNIFFQAYPEQKTDERTQTVANMQADYDVAREWFTKPDSETDPAFQKFVKTLQNATDDVQNNFLNVFDTMSQDLRDAPQRVGLVKYFQDNFTMVNVFDVIQMFKDIGEDIKRQHKRRQEQKIGKFGKSMTSWIPKSVLYLGKLSDEFFRREQQAELDEVEAWKKSLDNLDSYDLQQMLHHPANSDQMKAIINLLTDRGRMQWDDPDFWRSLSRFSRYEMPNILCQRDESLREEWLRKCCTDIWSDKDIYRVWKNTNDDKCQSERNKYKGEVDRLANLGGMAGELQKQLMMFVQAKHNKTSVGDNVNPHLYEAILDYAIRMGKMTMEDKFYYLVQGVAEGIIGADRLRRLAGEEGGYINIFPFIDYFYQRNNTLPEIKALAERLQESTDLNSPTRYKPGVKTTLWLDLELAREDSVQQRLGKGLDKRGGEMDHDDMHYFFARATPEEIASSLLPSGGGQQKFSGDAWENAYTGFNSFFKSYGFLAQLDKDNKEGAKFSEQDAAQAVSAITGFMIMDSILTDKTDYGDSRRARVGWEEMRNSSSIVSGGKQTVYEDRSDMMAVAKNVIHAYLGDMNLKGREQEFYNDLCEVTTEGGQVRTVDQKKKTEDNLRMLQEKLRKAVAKDPEKLKKIMMEAAPNLVGHKVFNYEQVKDAWEKKTAHEKKFAHGGIPWVEEHSAYSFS